MMEVWKSVPGYEGFYEVSSLGMVRSLPHPIRKRRGNFIVTEMYEGKILKQYANHKGYLMVRMYKNGLSHDFPVHHLVLLSFVPNPENLPQVNHKDEDKKNNRVENLEWCTNDYNRVYGSGRLRSTKPIFQFSRTMELIRKYESTISASRETGITASNINACLKNRRPTAGGFVWQYA